MGGGLVACFVAANGLLVRWVFGDGRVILMNDGHVFADRLVSHTVGECLLRYRSNVAYVEVPCA